MSVVRVSHERRRRVLVFGHTYTAPVNRRGLRIMASDGRFEFLVVAPRQWRNYLTATDNSAGEEGLAFYRERFLDTRFQGHPVAYIARGFRAVVRDYSPDLILCVQEPICLASLQVAVSSDRTPVVYFTWQNVRRRDPGYYLMGLVKQVSYRRSQAMIAGSLEAASLVRSDGYRKPIYVTPLLGVDDRLFRPGSAPQARQLITTDRFLIGCFGRFVYAKGFSSVLRAIAQVGRTDWHLLMVGAGPLRERLELEAVQLGIRDRLTFKPPVDHAEVPKLMTCCDAIVLPSLTTARWKEQFGHVLVEAMATGVPVVGSSSGEIPTVIGDTGLVFPEGDSKELARQLVRLDDQPSLRERLSRESVRRVQAEFTDARIAANFNTIIGRVLGLTSTLDHTVVEA